MSFKHFAATSIRLSALALIVPLALVACGGGDDEVAGAVVNPPPAHPLVVGTDVPVTATASADGAIAFIRSVIAQSSDTAEGLVLGNAVLGTSDTQDPQAL